MPNVFLHACPFILHTLNCLRFSLGEFYDTVSASGSGCLVRFKTADIGETQLFMRLSSACSPILKFSLSLTRSSLLSGQKMFMVSIILFCFCLPTRYPCSLQQSSVFQHCHLLSHEDNGAITYMNVTGVPAGNMNTVVSPSTSSCPA